MSEAFRFSEGLLCRVLVTGLLIEAAELKMKASIFIA
jgi:hypothetical protein